MPFIQACKSEPIILFNLSLLQVLVPDILPVTAQALSTGLDSRRMAGKGAVLCLLLLASCLTALDAQQLVKRPTPPSESLASETNHTARCLPQDAHQLQRGLLPCYTCRLQPDVSGRPNSE